MFSNGAEQIKATWTPEGGTPRVYRLRRDPTVTSSISRTTTSHASRIRVATTTLETQREGKGNSDAWSRVGSSSVPSDPDAEQSWYSWLWGLFVTMVLYCLYGFLALGIFAAVIGWIAKALGWSSEEADEEDRSLRAGWVDQTIQLLIVTAAVSREDQTLRDRERSLIKNIALSEAKRTDAPGKPNALQPDEVEALISQYQEGCPGVSALIQFLAEDPKLAALRARLLKRVWQIIVHDGPASEAEISLAENFASEISMTEEEYLAISRRFHHPAPSREDMTEARSVLEIPASATAEDVKRAYKRKAREYHPDTHAGASENLKQLAAEHFKKVCDAQNLLLADLDGSRLIAKGTGGRLVPASDLPEKIQCFSCAAIRPGTSLGEAMTARCPRCFTLLYHESDFAAELNRGPAASRPAGR